MCVVAFRKVQSLSLIFVRMVSIHWLAGYCTVLWVLCGPDLTMTHWISLFKTKEREIQYCITPTSCHSPKVDCWSWVLLTAVASRLTMWMACVLLTAVAFCLTWMLKNIFSVHFIVDILLRTWFRPIIFALLLRLLQK